jgi:hypothetical protein
LFPQIVYVGPNATQVIDLVTGRIFFSATHKKVAPPFHAVLSENWAVYTYFNEKVLP